MSQTMTPHSTVVRPLAILLTGAAVALAVGTYGRLHEPTGTAITTLGFSGALQMKAWLTTAAAVLGCVQLVSALRMYGRIGRSPAPTWIAPLHRWSGTTAFVLSVPVALHCLWALGYATYDTRVAVHSLLGCAFYGAFAAKMLALREAQAPRWMLPVLGSALLTVLAGLWLTASLWFFTSSGATLL